MGVEGIGLKRFWNHSSFWKLPFVIVEDTGIDDFEETRADSTKAGRFAVPKQLETFIGWGKNPQALHTLEPGGGLR